MHGVLLLRLYAYMILSVYEQNHFDSYLCVLQIPVEITARGFLFLMAVEAVPIRSRCQYLIG
jgi:hypothetical protein